MSTVPSPSAADVAATPSEELDPARRPLIILAVLATIVIITGTFIYSYPSTLLALRRGMILIHDFAGDLMILAGVVYLTIHLRRVWRMKRRVFSRWTGYAAVAAWVVVAVTGIYGQVTDMPSGSTMSTLHSVFSVALIVFGCFHGGHGLRRRFR